MTKLSEHEHSEARILKQEIKDLEESLLIPRLKAQKARLEIKKEMTILSENTALIAETLAETLAKSYVGALSNKNTHNTLSTCLRRSFVPNFYFRQMDELTGFKTKPLFLKYLINAGVKHVDGNKNKNIDGKTIRGIEINKSLNDFLINLAKEDVK